MIYESWSEQETFEIGKKMAENAVSGQIYCLDGDLGVGKTVFSKGFAWGLGIDRLVMMKNGIEDVRHFESAKLDFLRQF